MVKNNINNINNMNNSKVIGFDIDGVVTSNFKLFSCLKKDYGNFNSDNFIHYNVDDSLLHMGKIKSKSEFSNSRFFSKYAKEIYLEARVRAGVIDFIKMLYSKGYDVHFITARGDETKDLTLEFFRRNGIPVRNGRVHFVGSYDKGEVIKSLGIKTFFEDRGETIIDLLNRGIIERGYLVNTSYNKRFSHPHLKRFNSFTELLKIEYKRGA